MMILDINIINWHERVRAYKHAIFDGIDDYNRVSYSIKG